jgi:hypothetical protein
MELDPMVEYPMRQVSRARRPCRVACLRGKRAPRFELVVELFTPMADELIERALVDSARWSRRPCAAHLTLSAPHHADGGYDAYRAR